MTDLTSMTDSSLLLDYMSSMVTEYAEVRDYLKRLPGLHQAIEIGRQAIVSQYLTVVEMCGTLRLQISQSQMMLLDETMATVAAVLMLAPQSYRVSTVGSCSYQIREYPGSLFPFFLNILKSQGFKYDV